MCSTFSLLTRVSLYLTADSALVNAFRQFMLHNGADCFSGKTVLNSVSDGGLLATFAAHAGAKKICTLGQCTDGAVAK